MIKGTLKVFFVRLMRVMAVFALIVFLAVMARNIFFPIKTATTVKPQRTQQISRDKVQKEEGIRHFEYRGDKKVAEVKAERHQEEPDGRFSLEGDVEIHDFGKKDGEDSWIYGDKVVYNKDMTHYELFGRAKVKRRDAIVDSSYLEYDKNEDFLKTDRGATFSTDRMKGVARSLSYFLKTEVLDLHNDVTVELSPQDKKSPPLKLQGQSFTYKRKEKRGIMEKDVVVTSGKSWGKSAWAEFVLSEEEKYIWTLSLKGSVKAHLVEAKKKPQAKGEEPFYFQGEERDVEADEVNFLAFLNLPKIRSIETKNNSRLKTISSSGQPTSLESGSMAFVFDKWGGLREFKAADGAKMSELKGAGERQISADEIFIDGKKNILTAEKKKNAVSRIDTAESDVSADKIVLNLKNDNLEASGGVAVVLKPAETGDDPGGFFSRKNSIFAASQIMRYSRAEKRFVFTNDVIIWQDKEKLKAKEVTMFEENRKMRASGEVKSFFPHQPKKAGAREILIELDAGFMEFEPQKKLMSYQEVGGLQAGALHLSAKTLLVDLKENQGEIKAVRVKGGVSVVQDKRQGQADEGQYDPDEEKCVLEGNACLTETGKGKVQGDKLTFYMGDDRILIDNPKGKRTPAVIK